MTSLEHHNLNNINRFASDTKSKIKSLLSTGFSVPRYIPIGKTALIFGTIYLNIGQN